MIRFILLFSVLADPVAAQTSLTEQPGGLITVPRTETLVMQAPASGPLIMSVRSPVVELSAPEIVTLIAPPQVAPSTRPVPRPRALEVAEVAEVVVEAIEVVADVAVEVPVEAPVIVVAAAAPSVRPMPRPQTDAAVAMAEALAAQIAADARAIMASAPRAVPISTSIAPEDTLAPVQEILIPEVSAREIAPVVQVLPRSLTPPAVIPALTAALSPVPLSIEPAAMAAVLLPASAARARPAVLPVAFNAPPLERAPILPRLRPSGPATLDFVAAFGVARTATLSAVLVPSIATDAPRVPRLARALAPAFDRFPLSALPPASLEAGPDSMTRAIQPPRPFAEANAAVLIGTASVIPARLPMPDPSPMPSFDGPPLDPEAAIVLPEPDASALARMMDDAMICWRMADLSVEAQWARVSVDVALDETNMPSAQSIRLTGFAHVVSGAAENAYRAAHSALVGCAEASENAPATTSTTLLFDRSGVRLQ